MSYEDLAPARIAGLLSTRWCGRSLDVLAETASTNDDARHASMHGAAHGHVIVADRQTQGRGSRGRTWLSPAGSDLYLSIVVHSDIALGALAPITLAIGLAVAEAIDESLGRAGRAQVKWPNDVWVDRHKVAGILVESSSLGEQHLPLVVGLGLNVNRTEFPGDLETPASSLALLAGRPFDRAQVFARVLAHIEDRIDGFIREGVAEVIGALTPRLALRGSDVRCEDVVGRLHGVDERGALVIDTADGPRAVLSGTLRPLR